MIVSANLIVHVKSNFFALGGTGWRKKGCFRVITVKGLVVIPNTICLTLRSKRVKRKHDTQDVCWKKNWTILTESWDEGFVKKKSWWKFCVIDVRKLLRTFNNLNTLQQFKKTSYDFCTWTIVLTWIKKT